MTDIAAQASRLTKTFRITSRAAGTKAAIKSLFRPDRLDIRALEELSLTIEHGRMVGLLGPNGAGKTTTLKLMSGLLTPTSGEVVVLGRDPARREAEFLRQIALIRGSKPLEMPPQLTLQDVLRHQATIYGVPALEYRTQLEVLAEMLGLKALLGRQIRQFSLGERMRSGLAYSLIYNPRLLFLDEPTLGLDASAVTTVRGFIKNYNAETGATVVLTSHYMADVEQLCEKVYIIDDGQLVYEGALGDLGDIYVPFRFVRARIPADAAMSCLEVVKSTTGDPVSEREQEVTFRVRPDLAWPVATEIMQACPGAEISITEPPIDTVMDEFYGSLRSA